VESLRRVAALAGRRIDLPGSAPPRFPLARVPAVRSAMKNLFVRDRTELLISSAACGADLTALDVASELGIRCRVVLPFTPERFREESVVDRPGNWGPIYDRIVDRLATAGDLIVLREDRDHEGAFRAANQTIIAEAEHAALEPSLAVIVWEGESRGADDSTAEFRELARHAAFREQVILTS
jgi:hypothetical protein